MSAPRKIIRKPVQIAVARREEVEDGEGEMVGGVRLFALCNDGTIWYTDMVQNVAQEWNWWIVPTIPQVGAEETDIMDPMDLDAGNL